MGVLSVSSSSSANGADSCADRQGVAVKVTRASGRSSARDTSHFSARARKAAQTAAVETEAETEAAKSTEKSEEKSVGKTLAEMVKEQMEKIDKLFSDTENSNSNDKQLTGIKQKMRIGLTLSANEEQYLARKDPDLYSNYQTTVSARKMFRCQLANCRTKDEVNGMRLSNALSALSAYKKATGQGGDGSAVAGLNMALEREISGFAKSSRYRSLPTAAERDKYYMQLAKARKFEREKRAAQRQNALRKKKKQMKQPGDGKQTVSQVENSALGRKVRNAGKGGSCGVCFTSFAGSSYKKMDQKG